MYEIFFLLRDDWGTAQYRKRKGFKTNLQSAIKLAKKLGEGSYVKKYGNPRPVWINDSNLQTLLENRNAA